MKFKRFTAIILSLIIACGIVFGTAGYPKETFKAPVAYAADAGHNRYCGNDRYDTALQIAEAIYNLHDEDYLNAVIVADGRNFPDALAASYLSYKNNYAPILLTHPNSGITKKVTDYILSRVCNGGKVYIVGGTSVVSAETENMLNASSKGLKVKRLYGSDRYATNLAILEEAGISSGTSIVVATGGGFADSLSASATGMPILLVGGEFKTGQIELLKKISPSRIYIAGGSGVVNNDIETELNSIATTVRLAGDDRYDTSIQIAELTQSSNATILAYGKNFPDGLAAGPLAQCIHSSLILAEDAVTVRIRDAAWRASLGDKIKYGYVIGGDKLISEDTADFILNGTKSEISGLIEDHLAVLWAKVDKSYDEYLAKVYKEQDADHALTDAKKAYDNAVARYNGGAYSYFESRNSTDALSILNGTNTTYLRSKPSGFDTYTKNAYVDGVVAEGTAANLEMMKQGIEWLLELNECRGFEGLAPVTTNDTVWAMAMVNCNWATYNIGHSKAYNVAENLSWGYGTTRKNTSAAEGPYVGWYTEEKVNYETNNGGVTGHYTNIIESSTRPAALAFSNKNSTYGTVFCMDKDTLGLTGAGENATTYYNNFITYYNQTKSNINTTKNAIATYTAQVEAAIAAVDAGEAAYLAALEKYNSENEKYKAVLAALS